MVKKLLSAAVKNILTSLIALFILCNVSCSDGIISASEESLYPKGILSVKNGEAELSVNAINSALVESGRSILPSLGNDIYFTIVASTRKYGDFANLDPSKSEDELYLAHTTYENLANYAKDLSVYLDSAALDSNGDGFIDGMDLARPYFSLVTGSTETQPFKLKTNTQWYFSIYGTNESPFTIARYYRIGSGDYKLKRDGQNPSTQEDFVEYQNHWGFEEWSKLVGYIQEKAVLVGSLPLYIKDNGNSAAAGLRDQIQLFSDSEGSEVYDDGISLVAETWSTKKGHFIVPVRVPAASLSLGQNDPYLVNSVKISWNVINDSAASALASDGSIVWSRNSSDYAAEKVFAFYPEMGEGNYDLAINFYNSSDASGEPLYEIADDTLTIWGNGDSTLRVSYGSTNVNGYARFSSVNLDSSKLVRLNGSADTAVPSSYDVYGYSLTRSEIAGYRRTRFYVSNGAGDALKKTNGTSTGSIFAPYTSIQSALNEIFSDKNSSRLRNTLWYIVVDGSPSDSGALTITNPPLEAGESGDLTIVIQSYKPKNKVTLKCGLRIYNQNAGGSDFKFVLRNIDVDAQVRIATQNFVLDNAILNQSGDNSIHLLSKDGASEWAEDGLINVSLSDNTSLVKLIDVKKSSLPGCAVIRAYSIDYDSAVFHADSAYVPETADWLNRFSLYFTIDQDYELSQNNTLGDDYEGCLVLKRKT